MDRETLRKLIGMCDRRCECDVTQCEAEETIWDTIESWRTLAKDAIKLTDNC